MAMIEVRIYDSKGFEQIDTPAEHSPVERTHAETDSQESRYESRHCPARGKGVAC